MTVDIHPPAPFDDWHQTDDLHAETGKGDPFAAAMRATRMPMIITDPRLPDNPIVFANESFLRLTGYSREEVIGRNCRFLQGPDTNRDDVAAMGKAIAGRTDIQIDILNYRKDGSTFWNALYVSPVSNQDGELQFFFASQLDVTERHELHAREREQRERFEQAVKERTRELEEALQAKTLLLHEVDHRVKNNLQMVSSLIVMQARTIPDEAIRSSLKAMIERVEALSTVHRRLYQSDDVTTFDIAEFARDLVTDLIGASGRSNIRATFDLESVKVPANEASAIALMVNELVTNSLKHGFADGRAGVLTTSVKDGDGRVRISIEDDGLGPLEPDGGEVGTTPGFGRKLVNALGKQLRAEVKWSDAQPGMRVDVTFPRKSSNHLQRPRNEA